MRFRTLVFKKNYQFYL